MSLFLVALSAIAVASAMSETSSPCNSEPIRGNVFTSFRAAHSCVQSIVVPTGQSAQVFIANRAAYCGGLTDEEKLNVKITQANSTLANFCVDTLRTFTLTPGSYNIGVSASPTALKVSVKFFDAHLGCDDAVDDSLIDIPLIFVPTHHKCSIVLPSRTVIEIKAITRAQESSGNTRHCVRVRMGKAFYSLNKRWAPVCEVPDAHPIKYELGCNSIVMDASSLAIEKVEFVLRAMDDYKAVTAPLMCADEDV